MLWFDVEEGYNTTARRGADIKIQLWFDVEEGYNTTNIRYVLQVISCGLM